jgi:predicted DNA-binding protein (UPF0251 family)
MTHLEEVVLTVDEFEAIRLKDADGFEQEQCAQQMNISQPTFHRLYQEARKKIQRRVTGQRHPWTKHSQDTWH